MNLIEQLQESRKFAGLTPLSEDQVLDLAEKKLSGKEKEDFLAKMGKGAAKTKKDPEVDDGEPGPSKNARKAMKDADVKPSTKGRKKVSEGMNEALTRAGLPTLSAAQAETIDGAFEPLAEEEELHEAKSNPLAGQVAAVKRLMKAKGVNGVNVGTFERPAGTFVVNVVWPAEERAEASWKKELEQVIRTTADLDDNVNIKVSLGKKPDNKYHEMTAEFAHGQIAIQFVDPYDDTPEAKVGPFDSRQAAEKWIRANKFHPDAIGEFVGANGRLMSPEKAVTKFSEK